MQDVAFRTNDHTANTGFPTRAKPCSCGRQVVDRNDGYCITCGHLVATDIDLEWQQQAWRNRKLERKTGPPPFMEGRTGKLYRTAA